MAFSLGTRVRMLGDPTQVGVCTGRVRTTGTRVLHAIDFGGTVRWEPEYHVEELKETPEHPLELLEGGRLGRPSDLRRVLTQVRLAGRLEDFIYSMEVSDTDFYAYQFKPVLKMLNSPANGILIADEVGLGKTIEAGLIWTELRSRYDLRRLMVLCPAMLQEKWQSELRRRFGVKAEIIKAQGALDVLSGRSREDTADPFAIICSQQGLRPPRGWDDDEEPATGPGAELARFLDGRRGEEALIDLLVIDEAHYLRNPETQTARLGRLLRDVAEHVVLLSATPIHLRNRDLFSLMRLIDEDNYNQEGTFDEILEANAPLVRLRDLVLSPEADVNQLRELIGTARRHHFLRENRQLAALEEDLPSQEQLANPDVRAGIAHRVETINLLSNAVTRTRKREVHELRVMREVRAVHLPLDPLERRFYDAVTAAIRDYCDRREVMEGFLLATPQRQMASCMPAALRTWQQGGHSTAEELYEDIGIDEEDEADDRPLVSHLAAIAGTLGSANELERHDSKFKALLEALKVLFKESPGEKVVLFAYFKATLRYLSKRLAAEGIRSIVLSGDAGADKGRILEEFAKESGPNVLLSSEVGSEGVDLQFSRIVVNYDLPWNPMKVEQRIGRVDRIGQKADKISIWNLFYEGTIDQRIYDRLYVRLGLFRFALGDLEEVLGGRIRELTADLVGKNLTPEQEMERIDQTATALAFIARQESQLEDESASLLAYGDYVLQKIHETRDLHRWISGEDMFGFVHAVLSEKYAGCSFQLLDTTRILADVLLSNSARHDLETFMRENRFRQSTKLSGLSSAPVRCLFEKKVTVKSESGTEVIDQTHPLMRFASAMAESLYATRNPAVSIRLAQRQAGQGLGKGAYVFVVQKWLFKGFQDTERLYYAVATLGTAAVSLSQQDAERLIGTAARDGVPWLEAKEECNLAEVAQGGYACLDRADESYDQYVKEMRAQNDDRIDIRVLGLEKHERTQMAKLEEIRNRLGLRGLRSLVKATEGRMRALEERVRRSRAEAEARRKISCRKEEICAGIIQVE